MLTNLAHGVEPYDMNGTPAGYKERQRNYQYCTFLIKQIRPLNEINILKTLNFIHFYQFIKKKCWNLKCFFFPLH